MTGLQRTRPVTPLAETRGIPLMRIGVLEEADPVRTRAVTPVLPALIGARPFAIMAIGALEDEPRTVPADLAA